MNDAKNFSWTDKHQHSFDKIKLIIKNKKSDLRIVTQSSDD